MTAAHVPSLGRPPRRTTRQVGAVAAGIAFVLLIAAGLLLWQLTRSEESSGPTEAELTTPAAPAVTSRDQPAPTIYLVASPAQAQVVYADLEEANAVRVTSGEAPLAPHVTWFDSVEAEVFFWSTLDGQENIHVVDLRTPAARVPAPTVTPREQPASTIYLVASQAQADVLQRELNEGDALRAALGTAPLTASVLLLPSAEAESAFWLAIGEQETIRGGLGLDPVTVVDLRPATP